MFENLRADISQARRANVGSRGWRQGVKVYFHLGTLAVVSYRFGHWVVTHRLALVRYLLLIPAVMFRVFAQLLTGVHISPRAEIGPGMVVHTVYGIFIPPVKIGANFVVQTGVLIGQGIRGIGNDVYFGPGAKAIENTRIGNNVAIMPNSLVITDVPDNVTVAGVPARIRLPRLRPLWFDHGGSDSNNTHASKDRVRALNAVREK